MDPTLIVLNRNNTFAAVGPQKLVLKHLTEAQGTTGRFPPIVRVPFDRALSFVSNIQAPVPHGQGVLDAFDTNGRRIPLTTTDSGLTAGPATGGADPDAVLERINAVIAHLNHEATRPNAQRNRRDQQLVDAALDAGLLPITPPPKTLEGAVVRLFSSAYGPTPVAAARARFGQAVARTPLRAPLGRLPDAITGPILGGGWDDPKPPIIIIPHQAGWFHNLWHAVTGTH